MADPWKPHRKLAVSVFGRSFDELEEEHGEIDQYELRNVLDHALRKRFTTRERGILSMRYGLSHGEPLTFEKVGEYWGIGKERVRQIVAEALSKLRHPRVFSKDGFLRAVKGSDLYKKPWPEESPENRGAYPDAAVAQLATDVSYIWDGRRPRSWNASGRQWRTVERALESLNHRFFGRRDGLIDRKFLELHITKALLGLKPLDFAVMCCRYGFITGERLVQREAGRMCGIKGTGVSYIQRKCVPRLAEAMRKSMVRELKHEKGLPVVFPDPAPRERLNVRSPPNWGRM